MKYITVKSPMTLKQQCMSLIKINIFHYVYISHAVNLSSQNDFLYLPSPAKLYTSNTIWVIYTSVGWYLYLFFVLIF